MENEPSNLRESLWRRKPAAADRAALRADPELAAEARLTEALAQIPAAPVPSNFTARVLDALDREDQAAARSARPRWSWRTFFPRLAVSAAVLVFAGLNVQRYETISAHRQMARTVALVARTGGLPSMDALENLDAIQRMSQAAHADGELLADLK